MSVFQSPDGSQSPPKHWVARRHAYAVWELTLACDLSCSHCGSAAGKPRDDELTTEQALETVRRLKAYGITEVTLIGGEATIRKDWEVISREIVSQGMILTFQTGGYSITPQKAQQIKSVGASAVGVSVDGLPGIHDALRGRPGSHARALEAIRHLRNAEINHVTANSQINRANYQDLPALFNLLLEQGFKSWMLTPTIPMGSAVADEMLCFQPYDFEALHELSAILAVVGYQNNVPVRGANPLGYFGPYERLIRYTGDVLGVYQGCPAGEGVIGLEADGTVKGCPSLPTDLFQTGNILDSGLNNLNRLAHDARIKQNPTNKNPYRKTLYDFCLSCPFAVVCRSGCGWAASSIRGRKGDNPYCMFRSIVNNGKGRPEVMKRVDAGTMGPFARAEYQLSSLDAAMSASVKPIDLDAIEWPENFKTVAAIFRQNRQRVRDSSKKVYEKYTQFPVMNKDMAINYLEEMEAECMPDVALDAMANLIYAAT